MFEKYPNPIRMFSSKRDEWFLQTLEKLEVPVNLFSDIRDSQITQLSFGIESSKIRSTRGKKKNQEEGFNLYTRSTLESFLPRFGLSKMVREFMAENELSFEDLKEDFLSHPSIEKFNELARKPIEWIDVIPQERMDESYINMSEVILENFFSLVMDKLGIEDKSPENIQKVLKEKSPLLEQFLFQTLNLDILRALREKKWKEGENDTRIIEQSPKEGEVVEEDDKPKSFELTHGDYRGRSNVLYSFILELISYFEDSKNVPAVEKDDEGKFKPNMDPVPGTENMPIALTLEMLLFNPTPNKDYLVPVQAHMRQLAKISDEPESFFEILSRTYHALASGILIHSKPFKPFEKHYKNLNKKFWRALNEVDDPEALIGVIWMQYLHMNTIANQYKEAREHITNTFARFEHIFWQASVMFFGNKKAYETPLEFWSEFAKLDNLQLRNEDDAVKIFARFKEFLEEAGFDDEEKASKLDIIEIDRLSIYKRLAFIGLQSAEGSYREDIVTYIDKMDEILKKMEEEGKEYPTTSGIEGEKAIVNSLRDSLTVFDTRAQKVEA